MCSGSSSTEFAKLYIHGTKISEETWLFIKVIWFIWLAS